MLSVTRKILYFAAFIGLVATVAVAVGRIGTPGIATPLLWAGVTAAIAAGAGLVERKAWPAALVLVPLGAYLVLQARLPAPPGADTAGDLLRFYADQLRAGAHTYTTHGLPFRFEDEPQLTALLVMVMYATVALAAFLALSLRRALPAIVVLLAAFGFGLTVDESGRLVWLPLAFLVFTGALLTASRSLQRKRWRSGDAFAGLATAIVAGVLALSLLGTTSVARSTPWQDWRSWGSGKGTGVALAFDWMQDYPSLLNPQREGTVMRVKSPVASYWRANALDAFDGRSWYSSGAQRTGLTGVSDSGSYTYAIPPSDPIVPGRRVAQQFRIDAVFSDYLFLGATATSVTLPRELPIRLNTADAIQLDGLLAPDSGYSTTAVVPELQPSQLVGLGNTYTEHVLPFLVLPFPVPADGVTAGGEAAWRAQMTYEADRDWLGLYRLDRRIVRDATDPYQIALRIEEYLRQNYSYSLTPPQAAFDSPYAAFLFSVRSGYCQHFAGAMAILLRFNGIPARVAVGFTSGERDKDGWYVVGRNNAHAWVEAYFPSVGWVPFDPTPGRALPGAGVSSTNTGFQDPFTAVAARAGARGAGRAATPSLRRFNTDPFATKPGGDVVASGGSPVRTWLQAIAAVAAALAAWPLARGALRRIRLRRGDPERRLRAAVALIGDDLRDYGLAPAPSQTLDETAAFVRARVGIDATGLVGRVQAVLFGGRETADEDLADLAALHRDLRRGLRARHGLIAALRAAYGLPRVTGRPAKPPVQEVRRRAAEAFR